MKQTANLQVTSTAFENGTSIPTRYTCDGDGVNPPLKIDNLPEGTESIAIILEDPDAPSGTFTHWMVWDMPPRSNIEENSKPDGVVGRNGFGDNRYGGLCPPQGEEHRYFFKVYALDSRVDLDAGTQKKALEELLKDKAVGYGELMGTYRRF